VFQCAAENRGLAFVLNLTSGWPRYAELLITGRALRWGRILKLMLGGLRRKHAVQRGVRLSTCMCCETGENGLKAKPELYLMTQSAPRSKHTPSRL
jgi:hypothetical protein